MNAKLLEIEVHQVIATEEASDQGELVAHLMTEEGMIEEKTSERGVEVHQGSTEEAEESKSTQYYLINAISSRSPPGYRSRSRSRGRTGTSGPNSRFQERGFNSGAREYPRGDLRE
jgi:hypothetical protein